MPSSEAVGTTSPKHALRRSIWRKLGRDSGSPGSWVFPIIVLKTHVLNVYCEEWVDEKSSQKAYSWVHINHVKHSGDTGGSVGCRREGSPPKTRWDWWRGKKRYRVGPRGRSADGMF